MRPKIQESKHAIRRQILSLLKKMDPAQRAAGSVQACSLVEKEAVWNKARTILFYAPLPEELDIWPLAGKALASGKILALPRFDPASDRYVACRIRNLDSDIRIGRFGIREPEGHCGPLELSGLDLVLVPGVAFDLDGRRLGRGRGYYDRLLAGVCGKSCGVGFDEQIVTEIPSELHDVCVNCLVTPTRWIEL